MANDDTITIKTATKTWTGTIVSVGKFIVTLRGARGGSALLVQNAKSGDFYLQIGNRDFGRVIQGTRQHGLN